MRRIVIGALVLCAAACGGDPDPQPPWPGDGSPPPVETSNADRLHWVDEHFAPGWFPEATEELEGESEVAYEDGFPGEEINLDPTGEARTGAPTPPRATATPPMRRAPAGAEEPEENPRFGRARGVRDGGVGFNGADGSPTSPGGPTFGVPVEAPEAQPEAWQRSSQTPNTSRLMVGDDAELPLESFQATVRVDGHRARVVLDLCYRNDSEQALEGTFKLRLPDEAAVHHLAFGDVVKDAPLVLPVRTDVLADLSPTALTSARAGGSVQRTARVVPREKAHEAYAAETAQAVDPALLEWSGAGVFTTRLFPLQPQSTSRVTVAYDVELAEHAGNRSLRIDVPESVSRSRLTVQAQAKLTIVSEDTGAPGFTALPDGSGWTLVRDGQRGALTLAAPIERARPLVGDDPSIGPHLAVNVTPEVPATTASARSRAIFVLDVSMSSNPDRMNVWLDLIRAILERNRQELTEFQVVYFNTRAWQRREHFQANVPDSVNRFLEDARGLALQGASDLGAALALTKQVSNKSRRDADVFLMSDGAETWGVQDVRDVASGLGAPLYCYTTGLPGTDTRTLRALARATGGAVFSVSGASDVSAAAVAHRARPWTIREIRVEGCSDMLAAGRPASLYPGQTLKLAGRGRPRMGDDIVVTVEQDGQTRDLRVALGDPIPSALAPRAYGQIATGQLEDLEELASDEARAYALHYGVTGPTCSLLMLETDEDYAEYGILPTQDADVVRRRPVGLVTTELDSRMSRARGDEREAFLLWLDRVERLTPDTFEDLDAVRAAARSLPAAAFRIPALGGGSTWPAGWEDLGAAYIAELRKADPSYDTVWSEADGVLEEQGSASALTALSSLIEADPGSTDLMRDVAFTALDWDLPRDAYGLLHRVARKRPHEPETYRALAESLARMGRTDLAILMYELVLRGTWQARFGAFSLITAMDYRGLLRRIERGEAETALGDLADDARERIAAKYVSGDADLVVTMTWNTDRTDVDLHVLDPTGEDCYYGFARTRIGGAITADVTEGYGPEMFVLGKAVPGKYVVKAHYYGSDALRKTLRTRVFVTIARRFGTADEQIERRAFVLENADDTTEVLRLHWP